jgi:hypothetical protein
MGSKVSVIKARKVFLKIDLKKLDFLQRSRYEWMDSYLKLTKKIVEI